MSIQGSINSLLAMAAAGIRLSPGYESRVQAVTAQKKLSSINKQEAALKGSLITEKSDEDAVMRDILSQRTDTSRQLFEAAGSKRALEAYKTSRKEQRAYEAEMDRAAQERIEMERLANERAAIGQLILERGRA